MSETGVRSDELSPFHHGFVLVQSVSLVPHEVQDRRGGLLFEGGALPTETQPKENTTTTGYNPFGSCLVSQLAEFQVLFSVSPSLRVEVFGFVGDVVLLVFARLFAFLALGPFFTVRLQVSLSPTNHGGEHPLVETRKITCHEYVTR